MRTAVKRRGHAAAYVIPASETGVQRAGAFAKTALAEKRATRMNRSDARQARGSGGWPVSGQVEIWSDGSLVGAGASVDSGWKAVATFAEILGFSRHYAGGVYAFEIDWSREGSAIAFTEGVEIAENAQVTKDIAAPFARFRVRNTGAHAFTAHRTTVVGKRI